MMRSAICGDKEAEGSGDILAEGSESCQYAEYGGSECVLIWEWTYRRIDL